MKKNRRNYYRVLYVQPEAPLQVIKASYRALMGPLRQHPDLGGDHANAALLNEAYDVLSDPAKRRVYDRTLGKERLRSHSEREHPGAAAPTAHTPDPSHWQAERCCPFCRHALLDIARATQCTRCAAPLTPPQPASRGRELIGRRGSARSAKNHAVVLTPSWRAKAQSALMRDLSLTGIRLLVHAPIAVQQAIRIADADFDAVALVVSCRRSANLHTVHARFLTLRFTRQQGVFVSARA
jgi:curved DNA-binding protein CbpA